MKRKLGRMMLVVCAGLVLAGCATEQTGTVGSGMSPRNARDPNALTRPTPPPGTP